MGFSLKDPIQGSVTGNAGSADVAKKTQAALTIQKNGTTVGSAFDGSTARTINITVPTKVTDLSDNANYIKKTNYASTTAAGVIKLGTGLAIADGVLSVTGAATADSVEWSVVKNKPTAVSYWTNDAGYIKASNTMKGATSTTAGSAGTVPAPAAGKEAQFLRGDGTWAQPSYATSAGSATKATQDGNGKVIASTYLPLSGGTLTGAVAFGTSTQSSVPTTGIQIHDVRNATITPNSFGDRNVNFYFYQHSGWKSVIRMKGWNGNYTTWELSGPADSTTNNTLQFRSGVGDTWNGWKTIAFTDSNITGNAATATSATKATQDGNGKVISSTYLPLAGGKVTGTLTCSTSEFGTALIVERSGSTNMASIQFKNSNGTLGYIGMSTVNGSLVRYDSAVSSNYTFLDSGNYKTYTTVVHTGTAAPAASTGKNGDIYIVTG